MILVFLSLYVCASPGVCVRFFFSVRYFTIIYITDEYDDNACI